MIRTAMPDRVLRLGVVEFLNTLPLIDGLEGLADVSMRPAPPSALIDLLLRDEVDVALCSIIDYQRSPVPLKIVPAGLLGCDGGTMTVRLFSQVPIARITEICCDTDSHTSVTLLRVLLHEVHGIKPRLIDFDARRHAVEGRRVDWPEAMLLIGDKVVTDATPAIRYPFQLDLGAEWKEWSGLPFVFAAWLAKAETDTRPAGVVLDRQRRHNLERLDDMVAARADAHGWPRDLARAYLGHMLKYRWTDEARRGVELFFERAHRLGLIDQNRPLVFDGP